MAYATQADVLVTFDTPPSDIDKLDRIDALLEVVSAELDREVGFRFTSTGPTTRLFDGYGGSTLHVHEGIVGTPAVSFAGSWGGTLTAIASGDLVLVSDDPSTGSYDHVRLLGTTSGYGAFPKGAGLVSITGTFGFATVPADVKEAVVNRVRQLLAADPSITGGVVGPGEFGQPQIMPRYPHTTWNVIQHYRSRFASCYFGGFS